MCVANKLQPTDFMLAATVPAKGWSPRGGTTAAASNCTNVFAFGGADRAGAHFADLLMINVASGSTATIPLSPQPPASGGHAAAVIQSSDALAADSFSTTMIVHGGVNFAEERAFDSIIELAVAHPAAEIAGAAATWCAIKPHGTVPEARTGHTLTPLPLTLLSTAGAVFEAVRGTRCFLLFGGSSPSTGPMNDVHLLVAVPLRLADGPVAAADDAASAAAGPRFSYHWQQLATRGAAAEPREMHGAFVRPATAASAAVLSPPAVSSGASAASRFACTRLHPDITAAVIAALRADGRIDGSFCSDGIAAVTPVLSPAPAPAESSVADPASSSVSSSSIDAPSCEPPALVIVGGKNSDGGPQRDVCALDLATLKWAPLARCKQAVVSAASGAVPAAIDSSSAGAGPRPDALSAGSGLLFGGGSGCFGWRHLSFGGWDGESGLSGDLLQLDTRSGLAAADAGSAGRAASAAAAAGGAGADASPAADAATEASSSSGAPVQQLRIIDSSPALLRPSTWKWTSVDVRPRPTPAPRFAAAGAIVALPRPASGKDAAVAAVSGAASGAAGAGAASAATSPSAPCSFALACIGGMTASGDLAEVLIVRGS